jgi:hypothetical protein
MYVLTAVIVACRRDIDEWDGFKRAQDRVPLVIDGLFNGSDWYYNYFEMRQRRKGVCLHRGKGEGGDFYLYTSTTLPWSATLAFGFNC